MALTWHAHQPADGLLVLNDELEQDLEQLAPLAKAGLAPLLQERETTSAHRAGH